MQLKRTTLLLMLLLPFLFLQEAWAQSQVRGKVIDPASGGPLPSASVLVQGTSRGVLTDDQGEFTIQASGEDVLLISYIGYESQQVPVNNRDFINVEMSESVSTTDEVVVIGYGTQGRSQVTNAITKVSAEEISALPVVSAEQALQGRAAGVTVINNGSPGRGATIRIRGVNTVGANGPLYVIDGVPAGGLNEINPEDIESIDIAKDASATAIYGSRASGGVVFITTKKGKAGKPQVKFDAYYGVQSTPNTFDLLNTEQYIDYATDIQQNAGLPVPPRFSDPAFLDGSGLVNTNNNIDYMDEVFQTAPIQDYNVSVSGGSANSDYYVSGGYLNQQGIIIGTDFERYSFRTNTNFKFGKVKFGQRLNLAYSRRNNERNGGQNRSIIEHAIKAAPYMPVYQEDGETFKGPDQVDNNDAENPVRNQSLPLDFNETLKLLGNVYVELEIIEGLNLRQTLGVDMAYGFGMTFTPAFQDGDFHGQGFADLNQDRSDFFSPLSTTTLNFDRDFGDHSLNVLLGYEWQYFRIRNTQGEGQNFVASNLLTLNSFSNDNVNGFTNEDEIQSQFARLNYSYANRYLFQAVVRRDGYSRFGPANKFGVFPSISAGWNIHEEAFMAGQNLLSTLKVRGSWGRTGNNAAPQRYEFQPTVNLNFNYGFEALAAGGAITNFANPNIAWEAQQMLNIGIDLGFMNDQFTFTAEYYDNQTRDMLLSVNLPPSHGFSGSPRINTGEVRSNGVEFTLGYASDPTKDFSYSINANFATQTNEVTSLGQGNPLFERVYEGDPLKRTVEGEPLYHFFGWQVDRLFQGDDFVDDGTGTLVLREGIPTQSAAQPGDIKFRDIAGPPDENGDPTGPDGIIDANDRTNLGNAQPTYLYGLNGDFRYKNFTFNIFFQGQGGNYIYNTNRYELEGMTRVFNAGVAVLDRWTPENTETQIPRGVTGDPNRNTRASTRFLERGDYLRAKLVRLGYNFDTSALNWASRVNVYVASQNLFTITNYTGLDPEIGTRQGLDANTGLGLDFGQYPQARTFMIGVQASF